MTGYEDIFGQINPYEHLEHRRPNPIPSAKSMDDPFPVLDSTLDHGDNIAATARIDTQIFGSNGNTWRLMRARVVGPVKDAWISGWLSTGFINKPDGFGNLIGQWTGGPPGVNAAVLDQMDVTFKYGSWSQGEATALVADLGDGIHFSFPCNYLEVFVRWVAGTPLSPLPTPGSVVRGGLSLGKREVAMKLTWTQFSGNIVSGGTFSVLPPPFAKTLAIYHSDLANSANVNVLGGPVGNTWQTNQAINAGQAVAALDIPNGANRIQITNLGPNTEQYTLVWGLDT